MRFAHIKFTTVGLASVSFCIACILTQRTSEGADLSGELRMALRGNAEQLSPITIFYTQELFSSISPQETMNKLGIGSRDANEFFYKGEHQSAWQEGKLYSRGDQLSSDGVSSMVVTTEASFDGSALYFGDMRTKE